MPKKSVEVSLDTMPAGSKWVAVEPLGYQKRRGEYSFDRREVWAVKPSAIFYWRLTCGCGTVEDRPRVHFMNKGGIACAACRGKK